MTRGKKYIIFSAGIAAFMFSPCLIKTITGYPCPACGTRRALLAVAQGNIIQSFLINPYAILLINFFIILFLIVTYDYFTGKSSLLSFRERIRKLLLRKDILLGLVCFTILNWIWNIYKGL